MHVTTAPRKESNCITLAPAKERANFLPVAVQIQLAAVSDKRQERRKMKERRKQRKWRPD